MLANLQTLEQKIQQPSPKVDIKPKTIKKTYNSGEGLEVAITDLHDMDPQAKPEKTLELKLKLYQMESSK